MYMAISDQSMRHVINQLDKRGLYLWCWFLSFGESTETATLLLCFTYRSTSNLVICLMICCTVIGSDLRSTTQFDNLSQGMPRQDRQVSPRRRDEGDWRREEAGLRLWLFCPVRWTCFKWVEIVNGNTWRLKRTGWASTCEKVSRFQINLASPAACCCVRG